MNCYADAHGGDDGMFRAEPFGTHLERACQRRLVINQAWKVAPTDQLDRTGPVSFHPIGLCDDNEAALTLLGELPRRHYRQILDVLGPGVPLRPYCYQTALERDPGSACKRGSDSSLVQLYDGNGGFHR